MAFLSLLPFAASAQTSVILTPTWGWGVVGGYSSVGATNMFNHQPTWGGTVPSGGDNGAGNSWIKAGWDDYEALVYIDFGPNYANLRIRQCWTQYNVGSSYAQAADPYLARWWGTSSTTPQASGIAETQLNFDTQNHSSGTGGWYKDLDVTSTPITPKARYLIMTEGHDRSDDTLEYAFVGYTTGNQVPAVNAGSNQTITLPSSAVLSGSASDDGLPAGSTLTTTWAKVSGPGNVTFGNPATQATSATFTASGTYVLQLTATDSAFISNSLVTITVNVASISTTITPPVATGLVSGNTNAAGMFDHAPTWNGNNPVGGDPGTGNPWIKAGFDLFESVSYIDFGANYANYRIQQCWTQYLPGRTDAADPYLALWWGSSTTTTQASGMAETNINFDTQSHSSGAGGWIRDRNFGTAITPPARYLMLKENHGQSDDPCEYAFVGYIVGGAGNDTNAPTLNLITPTSGTTYSTGSNVLTNIGGTVSDNVALANLTWSYGTPVISSGNATVLGTSWSIPGLPLKSGNNTLTLTARDTSGNTTAKTLAITFTPPTDTIAPTIAFTSPTTSPTSRSTAATVNLWGVANDNVGVTQVSWSNNRGGSGNANLSFNGATSAIWSVNAAALYAGVNVITVTARDAANNTKVSTLTFTRIVTPTGGKTVTIGMAQATGTPPYFNYPGTAQISALNLQPGDTLYIAAGNYGGISLGDLNGTAANPITVICDPNAIFTYSGSGSIFNSFNNVSFVHFLNFRFENYNGRSMMISGASHDLLFQNFHLQNVSDYGFYIYDAAKVFNGTKASAFYNLKWENSLFEGGIISIMSSDYQPVSNMKSVLLDFEIVDCTFRDVIPNSATIQVDKAFNMWVHDCVFTSLGQSTTPIHVAALVGSGYFKVNNNTFAYNWGDEVRCMPLKLNALGYNGADSVNRFYNNISFEKRKYAMFEINDINVSNTDIANSGGYLSRAPTEIYFNTLYRSRQYLPAAYEAPLVDLYAANVTIRHNLVIEPEVDTLFNPSVNYIYAGTQSGTIADNNITCQFFSQSGLIDTTTFAPSSTSPVRNAATEATGCVPYIATDTFNNPRYMGSIPDIGAVENQQ